MIRVVTLDRQPLTRLGLGTALGAQHDLVELGAAAHERELWPLLYRADPNVVVIGECDAAPAACLRIKRRPPAPRVVLFADRDPGLVLAATIAGADGVADRSLPLHALLTTIRTVASGTRALPPVSPREQVAAASRLEPADHPIFAMRLAGTSFAEIAATLRITRAELSERTAAILTRLAAPAPQPERRAVSPRARRPPFLSQRPRQSEQREDAGVAEPGDRGNPVAVER
jgi:DNA-binding NarL/FixJ family response regulator